MKKFSLVLALLLFSCQGINQKILDLKTDKSEVLMQEGPTHNQFESKAMDNFQLPEKKTRVALFVPLSGKNKDLGWSLFNAATLSLFANDINHNIEIVLFDSKDSPDEAKDTFDEIVKQDIKVVIGPVFSSQIKEISSNAKRNKITVISLSNNQELLEEVAEKGGVFLAGMLPEAQIDKIVGYAMSRGKYSFATISPNNQYGKTITDLMKTTLRNRDGNFISAEFYNNTDKDIDRAVANIVNVFNVSGHLMEGKNKLKKNAVISENDRIYPQIIMIPESGKTLSKIVASIKKQNVDEREFQIVGTSGWDDISTMNDFNLLGAWFVAPENEKFREFERSYYRSFNKFPPRISSIVYDSVAAVAAVTNHKEKEVEITINDFIKFDNPPKNGFDGIDGSFRFLPNGLVQRNLAVLQVGSGKFDTIEKPNEMFLKY